MRKNLIKLMNEYCTLVNTVLCYFVHKVSQSIKGFS